jgi:hypothetical protein
MERPDPDAPDAATPDAATPDAVTPDPVTPDQAPEPDADGAAGGDAGAGRQGATGRPQRRSVYWEPAEAQAAGQAPGGEGGGSHAPPPAAPRFALPTRPAGRPWPSRRKPMIAAVAAGVVVLGVAVAVRWSGSGEAADPPPTGPIAAALKVPDPVAKGPIVTSIPPDCGVSPATVDRLTPRAEGRESAFSSDRQICSWGIGGGATRDGGTSRELRLEVAKNKLISDAIEEFDRLLSEFPDSRLAERTQVRSKKVLPGLGDEAVVWYRVDTYRPIRAGGSGKKRSPRASHATILFRQGNLVVTVEYGGADYAMPPHTFDLPAREKVLGERSAVDGARLAASDAARSIGLPAGDTARPREGAAETGLVKRTPEPCGLLRRAVQSVPAVGRPGPLSTTRPMGGKTWLIPTLSDVAAPSACYLGGGLAARLEVAVLAVPKEANGGATGTAARAYQFRHTFTRDSRAKEAIAEEPFFAALKAPAEQAFVYAEGGRAPSAELVFRKRNLVVGVRYAPHSGSVPRDKTLNQTYALATALAAALPA